MATLPDTLAGANGGVAPLASATPVHEADPAERGSTSGASPRERRWALGLLLAIATVAFIDRTILNTVGEAVKRDLGLTDLQLGLLGGAAFALLNGLFGIPVARLAERHSRARIIAVAVAIWSAMTALCGLAGGFGGLLAARIGVGVGEAGAGAPAQSLLADYFPPERRATAFGILGLATPLGIILGAIGGAVVAQAFGWRAAFMLVGLPGIALAALTWLTLREPPRGLSDGRVVGAQAPPLREVVRVLADSRAFRWLLVAGTVVNFVGLAGMSFAHPFFVRSFPVGYTEAAVAFALINSVSLAAGYYFGGTLSDRLGRRDVRWYGWLPAICMVLAAITYVIGFSQSTWFWTVVLLTPPGLFAGMYYAPTFAITHNLVGPRMRASAAAILTLTTSIVGMTLGPIATGLLSDHFASAAFAGDYGAACPALRAALEAACRTASSYGLRMALVCVCTLYLFAGLAFLRATRTLPGELAHLRGHEA